MNDKSKADRVSRFIQRLDAGRAHEASLLRAAEAVRQQRRLRWTAQDRRFLRALRIKADA